MKLKSAYIDYLRNHYSVFDLQKIAQQDIEELNIPSETLFHFAYILDEERDRHATFLKELEKIGIEFGFLKSLDHISENDIKGYFDNKILGMRNAQDNTLMNKFLELRDFYQFLEEKSNNHLELFLPGFRMCESDYENFLQVFNRFYQNKALNEQIVTVLYRSYCDDYPDYQEEIQELDWVKTHLKDI